jgi:hypothetical protein
MPIKIVPMIHVPDVRATADLYVSIGFTLVRSNEARRNEEDGQLDWALLSLGGSEIMLSLCGMPSTAHRREFDLYIHVENVASLYNQLKTKRRLWKRRMTLSTACVNSSSGTATASGSPLAIPCNDNSALE